MGDDDKKDVKPSPAAANAGNKNLTNKNKHWQKRGGGNTPSNKYKVKTKEIEDNIFDLDVTHDAALFSRSLKNIAYYIQLKHTSNVSKAVRNMTSLAITIPPPPTPITDATGNTTPVSEVDFYLWKWDHSKAQDRKDKYDKGMKSAYTFIFHQCSPTLKMELEGSDAFPSIRASQDVLELLKMIKGLCCSFNVKIQGMMATVEVHNDYTCIS
jgi:hypothetical protein